MRAPRVIHWRDPAKKKRVYREQSIQTTVADWLSWALEPPAFFTYFPAGSYLLSEAHARKMKRSGLKPGMPDLWIICGARLYCIEMKVPKSGRLNANQELAHPMLRAAGAQIAIATTLEAVMTQCREWGLPLRDKPVSPVDALARSLARSALDVGD